MAAFQHLLAQRLMHAGQTVQALHAIAESADARQHDSLGAAHFLGIGCHHHLVAMAGLGHRAGQRLGDRAQIPRSIINHGDGHYRLPPSTPLVEGTASALRGSRVRAWRRARARPL